MIVLEVDTPDTAPENPRDYLELARHQRDITSENPAWRVRDVYYLFREGIVKIVYGHAGQLIIKSAQWFPPAVLLIREANDVMMLLGYVKENKFVPYDRYNSKPQQVPDEADPSRILITDMQVIISFFRLGKLSGFYF